MPASRPCPAHGTAIGSKSPELAAGRQGVLNEIQKYWRDRLMELLAWGTALLLLVAGWSVSEHDAFEFFGACATNGSRIRAAALILFSCVYTVAWRRAIRWVFRTHLDRDVDGTVLPRKYVERYSTVLGAMLITLSILMGVL